MGVVSTHILSFSDYIQQFFTQHQKCLEAHYPGLNARLFLQNTLEFSRQNQIEISAPEKRFYAIAKLSPLKEFFEQVLLGIPFEYLTRKSFFYRSEFNVNADVLIPRSETEILVEYAVEQCRKIYSREKRPLRIADIGTGSGAIILSILRECSFPIEAIATDIDEKALAVAKRNDFSLKYTYPFASNIQFRLGDRLAPITIPQDMIVSNPPYIKRSDRSTVHDQVDLYEPHLALYLEDQEYGQWYQEYFLGLSQALASNGIFVMEGHEDHLESLAEMAKKCSLELSEIKNDYTQRKRFLILKKTN